jgi:hypothetical protein
MKGGHIAGVEADALQDLSDQQAINKARELFAARKDEFDGFKVWQGARMVIQEPPPDDKPPVSKPRCPGPYRAPVRAVLRSKTGGKNWQSIPTHWAKSPKMPKGAPRTNAVHTSAMKSS